MRGLEATWEPGPPYVARLSLLDGLVPLSVNEAKGRHWAGSYHVTSEWRSAAFYGARQAINRGVWPKRLEPGAVLLTIRFQVERRRDSHNYTGTIVKAVVDGLVNSGLWPDDTPEWVSVLDPDLRVGPGLPEVTILQRREDKSSVVGEAR